MRRHKPKGALPRDVFEGANDSATLMLPPKVGSREG
jgi:hypothetical protein